MLLQAKASCSEASFTLLLLPINGFVDSFSAIDGRIDGVGGPLGFCRRVTPIITPCVANADQCKFRRGFGHLIADLS